MYNDHINMLILFKYSTWINFHMKLCNLHSEENANEEATEEEKKPKSEEKKLTPAEYRRQQGRRPPIKSIIKYV